MEIALIGMEIVGIPLFLFALFARYMANRSI
jgi:hypothetical protein